MKYTPSSLGVPALFLVAGCFQNPGCPEDPIMCPQYATTGSGTGGTSTGSGGENTGGTGGSAGSGGMAGAGGMTTSMGGSSGGGGMAGSGGSGGNTTSSMSGSCDNGVLVSPDANTDMKSTNVVNGTAGDIADGSACWVPSGSGDAAVFSVAAGASPCSGQSVSATAVFGPNAKANCPGGIVRYMGCSAGCIALNTASAMEGAVSMPPAQSADPEGSIAPCNGQKLTLVYECVAN